MGIVQSCMPCRRCCREDESDEEEADRIRGEHVWVSQHVVARYEWVGTASPWECNRCGAVWQRTTSQICPPYRTARICPKTKPIDGHVGYSHRAGSSRAASITPIKHRLKRRWCGTAAARWECWRRGSALGASDAGADQPACVLRGERATAYPQQGHGCRLR